jgi:hypothetical protein
MLLSRQKKFLFVHIQKTGGTSLHQALQSAIPDLETFRGTHDHAAWARPHLAAEWGSYFKAAFVRNPWDRLVSWYSMIAGQSEDPYCLWKYVRERASSFEEFLDRCIDTIEDIDGTKSFLFNQLDYLSDGHGRLLVDFVGRFEYLAYHTDRLFEHLGLEAPNLPHARRSQHRHYSTYYTERTRQLVEERYRHDIDYFGYTFERAAVA